MIAAKRERYAQALCAYSLLAATQQMAVWFMWNSSLYGLAFIYRLNQSKVYIWSDFCKCGDGGVWLGDCSEKEMVYRSIMRTSSFGYNPTNGYMVYVE